MESMENKQVVLKVFDSSDLINDDTFPSVKDLACLSHAVYYQTFGSKSTSDISESNENEPIIKPLQEKWKLLATSQYKVLSWSLSIGDGYHGAAYYNVSTKHLVVAHRGTELTNIGSLWTDVKGVAFNGYTSQMKSAYKFTRQIVDRFWECAISISVTGHSLGGWLSQTSAFFIKYPQLAEEFDGIDGRNLNVDIISCAFKSSHHLPSHHLHVVAFDSPGALNIMASHLLKHIPRYSDDRHLPTKYLNELDVTTYFSSPNAINSTNLHIGSLFMMPNVSDKKGLFVTWTDTFEFLKYTFDSHNMKNIVRFWQSVDFPEGNLLKVTDWPVGFDETNAHHKSLVNELTKTKFLVEPIDINSVRMCIFDREEREFLEEIYSLKKYGVVGENMSWETMFKEKANEFNDSTHAKNIFEFFDSFEIVHDQVLKVDNRFRFGFFIRLVKYFMSADVDLRTLVKEVMSELPKVYQSIYRALSTEYLQRIPEVQVNDFTALQTFVESTQLKVYEAVAKESTLICIAKILNALKTKQFSFGGDVYARFDMRQALFLNADLLTILDRHVSIARIVPPKDELKLILVENSDDQFQPILQSLIEKVLRASSSSPLVKLILVTSKKIDFQNHLQQTISSLNYLEKEIGASDQAILFENLSIDQQNVVLESEICFQGKDMPLKNLVSLVELQSNPDALDQSTLRSLLSRKRKQLLGGCVNTLSEFERSYYIPRHFHKIILSETDHLLSWIKKKTFHLVITYQGSDARNQILKYFFPNYPQNPRYPTDQKWHEWQGDFDGFKPERHRVILVDATTQSPNYYSFCSHFDTNRISGLWLMYANQKWYWQLTFGKVGVVKWSVDYDELFDEKEMLGLHRPLIIVSDEPGMGKSTLLKNLAEQCKTAECGTGKASWVIFVNLENVIELLRQTSKDLDSAIDFLFQIPNNPKSSVGKCILKYLLQQVGRVTIFFDGLDEVTNTIQSKVLDIVKLLLRHTKAKVFISSRLHLRSTLEYRFSIFINTFLPLDQPERINFLTKFWIGHPDFPKYEKNSISIDAVNSYASQLLQMLQRSLNIMQADSFIGVPLQLFMLGIISLPHVCSILSNFQLNSGHSTECHLQKHMMFFENIFDLYEKFVSAKIRISLEEKIKLTQLSEYYPWHNRQLVGSLIELHRICAFFFLFPNEYQVFQCSNNILDYEEMQVLLGVGIVQSSSIDDLSSIKFIHRSLAEYFAADFIVSRLTMPHFKEKAIDFLRNKFFLPQFFKISFFINHFISMQPECDPIFRKCIDWEKEKLNIFTMLDGSNSEAYDLLGRNVLHYAICYGDHEHDNGILWCLIQNYHLINRTDVFGCNFLSYIILLPNLSVNCPSRMDRQVLEQHYPDLNWIIWFVGPKTQCRLLEARPSVKSIRSRFDDAKNVNAEQTEKFLNIINAGATGLNIALKLGDCNSSSSPLEVNFLDEAHAQTPQIEKPMKNTNTCSTVGTDTCISSTTRDKVEMFVDIALEYLKSPEQCLKAFEIAMTTSGAAHVPIGVQMYEVIRDLRDPSDIAGQMLDVMTRDNFTLFKNGIEFIGEYSRIVSDLLLNI